MTSAFEVTDAEEIAHAQVIGRRIEQGRSIHSRFETVCAVRPTLGSDLHGDDSATAWMHTSHVVTTALTMATENIRAVGEMLLPGDHLVVPMYAHYPILRSVLEASALAKWLLVPDERDERIVRSLRARLSDAQMDAALRKEEVETVRSLGHDDARLAQAEQQAQARRARDLAKIKSICEEQKIDWGRVKSGLPPWVHLIRSVCLIESGPDRTAVPGGYAAGLWKIMSGLSHPSTSRSVNHSTMERLESDEADGLVLAKLSASLRWTVESMTLAWNTAHEAVDLMERRQSLLA